MASKKLLIIGFVWPEPKGSAAGSRMMQLIEFFKKHYYQITFCSASSLNEHSEDLSISDVTIKFIELNSSSFDEFISELNPEIVLFDRFMTEEQYGWRVAENCPKAVRILDSEDLHFLRKGREEALKNNKEFTLAYLYNKVAKREIASIYRCDLTLIISEFEMDLLKNQFNIGDFLLCYLPFLLNKITKNDQQSLPTYNNRKHFITIGNFLHPPNLDAVMQLKKEIWPLIKRKLPKAELHVYGAYPPQKALQLNNQNEGFIIKGFIDDADHVMSQSRLCLVPLRFGAGLKGKLISAMINGTPAVMSSIAAEGMFGNMPPNGEVCDDDEEFANKAIQLYLDQGLWKEKQLKGNDVINRRFQQTNFYKELEFAIEQIRSDLEAHRRKNFMGQMLMHHSMQSTKFMGKWIEEKNIK